MGTRLNLKTKRLLVLLTLSGGCGLAYEVLYQRALSLLLGDTPTVAAAIFTVFLLGVGIGAKLAYRALSMLPYSEIFCGLYALAFPWILGHLQNWSGLSSFTGSPLKTTIAATILLLPPSLFVGLALPLFAHHLATESQGKAFNSVYQWYHLGAIAGVVLVEFWCLQAYGLAAAFRLLGMVNLLVGFGLLRQGSKGKSGPTQPREFGLATLSALCCVGIASGIYQMLVLSFSFHLFHPHRQNFTLVLLLTFMSLSVGALWVRKMEWEFQHCCAAALCALPLSFVLVPVWAKLHFALTSSLVSKSLILLLFAFPSLVFFGAVIPALMRTERAVAAESGQLLWWSSIGNICGYLSYVLLLHQSLPKIVILVVCMSLLGMALVPYRSKTNAWYYGLAGAFVTAAFLSWNEASFHLPRYGPDYQVSIYKSGPDTALLFSDIDSSFIAHNGHYSIRCEKKGKVNLGEVLAGVVPYLYTPRQERAFVMGHGSGITGGTTALLFRHTDVVEINQAFLMMSRQLEHLNFRLAENPRATVLHADARAALVGRVEEYDLILNSITRPTYYAAGKVYTRDFFQIVARALKPDGVYATWISAEMSGREVTVLIRTLQTVFTHAALHQVDRGYFLVVCSRQPLTCRQKPIPEPLMGLLGERFPELDPEEVLPDLQVSREIFSTQLRGEINTDDKPVLEHLAVKAFEKKYRGFNPIKEFSESWQIDPVRKDGTSPERLKRRAEVYRRLRSELYPLFSTP